MKHNHHTHQHNHNSLSPSKHCESGHHAHNVQTNFGRAFILAIVLNTAFVAIEFFYGFTSNSTALMADAGHNLSDVLSLLLAWGASILSRKSPSKRYTYGLRSTSIIAAVTNAMFLLLVCGAIAWEAIQRFSLPPVVAGLTVMQIAAVGIVINGLSAWLFVKGSKGDLNIRGAFLHMATDALVSLGVVIAGATIIYTDWYWLDPSISLIIVVIIIYGTWGLFRESMQLALSAVPASIDLPAIDSYLRQHSGVTDIHDLHVWGMSTTETALTVHLVMPDGYPGDAVMDEIMRTLRIKYSIHHSTLQIEQGTTDHSCSLNAINLEPHHDHNL